MSIVVTDAESARTPLTFADIVRTGAMCCKIVNSLNPQSGGRFTDEELQLLETILATISDPEEFSAMLLNRVQAEIEDADQLARLPQAVIDFMHRPYNVRQLLQRIIREVIPPSTPGRKRKINDADIPKLLQRANQLRPAVTALVQITEASRKRPIIERLKYLQPDYPEACDYLLKYVRQLEMLSTDKKLLDSVATPESAVRLIADGIAGAEFEISPRYSIRLIEEARRAVRRRSKRTIPHKM